MRKDARCFYPTLAAEIARSGQGVEGVRKAIGMSSNLWCGRRYGESDWKLSEMLLLRALLAPNMTLDELFRREVVRHNG